MAQQDFDPDLNHLGRQLRGLAPRSCPLNRDAVMFRAGQASVPYNWLWPVVAAISTCLAATFGAALVVQPASSLLIQPGYVRPPMPVEVQPVYPSAPDPQLADEPIPISDESVWDTPDTQYLRLQNNVLRWGLDGLPMAPPAPAPRRTEKPDMLFRSF